MTSQERSVFITIIRKLKMHDFVIELKPRDFLGKGRWRKNGI